METDGAYLAEALGIAGECHTPRNVALALNNRQKFAGTVDGGLARLQQSVQTRPPASAAGATRICFPIFRLGHAAGHGTAFGPDGRGGSTTALSQLAPERYPRHGGLFCVACLRLPRPIYRRHWRPAAPASHKDGGGTPDPRGKMVFEGSCAMLP